MRTKTSEISQKPKKLLLSQLIKKVEGNYKKRYRYLSNLTLPL